MKTNIKMIVTPEQSMKVQDIVIMNTNTKNKVDTTDIHFPYIIISNTGTFGTRNIEFYKSQNYKEIDADLFIRTNGTCEEISNEGLSKIKAASEGKSTEHLQEKIINLHKQINKDRATIKNQREELHKLNLRLQKCISLEEHRKVLDWHIERNESLFAEIDNLKAENIEMGKLVNLNKSALDLAVITKELAMNEIERKNKEIEKLKAVIEYLESKVK